MMGITERQEGCYRAIEKYMALHGQAPTVRELTALLGLRSTSAVARLMDGLRERKWIKTMPGRSLAIELLGDKPMTMDNYNDELNERPLLQRFLHDFVCSVIDITDFDDVTIVLSRRDADGGSAITGNMGGIEDVERHIKHMERALESMRASLDSGSLTQQ